MVKRACFFCWGNKGRFFLLSIMLLCYVNGWSQNCTLTPPQLFGLSQTAIYCKEIKVQSGVAISADDQLYTFALYSPGGVLMRTRGGPLDGSGSTLSVASFMRSAADAGEYRVTTSKEGCPNTLTSNFYVFYNSIDNLTITSWGSGQVAFKWAAAGPRPEVTYEYAVTTSATPPVAGTTFTTDTIGSRTGLTNNTVYFIHVRVASVIHNGNDVEAYFDCPFGEYPWETSTFRACTAVAALTGSVTPANALVCTGSPVTLTASGGVGYQWYRNNVLIAGQTASTLSIQDSGQYKVSITTAGTCQGQAFTSRVTKSSIVTGVLTGGGNYCFGATARLALTNTSTDQTYTIRRGATDIATVNGIGKPQESFNSDTLWYSIPITSAIDAGTYTVRTNNGFCTPIIFGNAVITVSPNTWNGSVSTAWTNAANWSCGVVPDANSTVVVPAGVPRMPLVTSNVSCFKLTVNPGATVTVNPGFKLTVTGTGP
jgi:hypothetical protein